MKKRDMDGLIIGGPCGDFKTKGITIFIYIENGTIHLEFLCISSDVTESGRNIPFKRTRLVLSVCLGTIDFIEIPTAECLDGISSHICPGEIIPGSIANGVGHHIASQLFHKLDEFNIIKTGAINKYTRALIQGRAFSSTHFG
jgi:hypothetical protein